MSKEVGKRHAENKTKKYIRDGSPKLFWDSSTKGTYVKSEQEEDDEN